MDYSDREPHILVKARLFTQWHEAMADIADRHELKLEIEDDLTNLTIYGAMLG